MGVGIAFAVKARRAESEIRPECFIGTGPRTVDRDRLRPAVPDSGVVPDSDAVPEPWAVPDGNAVDPLVEPLGDALSGPTASEASETFDLRADLPDGLPVDLPAAEMGDPTDEVIDRSCPLMEWRWVKGLWGAADGLLAVRLPGLVAEPARVEPVELEPTGFEPADAELPVDAPDEAGAADAGEVAELPEVRSRRDPAPAAEAEGCSVVAGGRASVEVDLSVDTGF